MDVSPDRKIAGVLAPLFALRGERDLGVGDLAALREFVDWTADAGFKVIQMLPVNETGTDNSPYMAISSVALEPSTLDLSPGAVDGLTEELLANGLQDAPRAEPGSPVDYAVVKPLKLRILSTAFDRFRTGSIRRNAPRARQFQDFCIKEGGWLDGYALFRALIERHGTERWDVWPEENRTAAATRKWLATLPAPARRKLEGRVQFFKFVQWQAFQQWKAAKVYAESRGVALMGDVPFGLSLYSADVWSDASGFDLEWSGGAPPEPAFAGDEFVRKWGQNWGIPLYRWDKMRGDGFAWWRQRIHAVREVFHLFRVDHVLGFYRVYAFPWYPDRNAEFAPLSPEEAAALAGGRLPRFHPHGDDTEENRLANCSQGEEILRVLIEEAGPHRLIAEDLGVVPPYVRPSLARLKIAGFKVPQWERLPKGGLVPGETYERLSVTTYATHDHETLRGMWDRWAAAFAANERGEPGAGAAAWAAGEEMRALMRFAGLPENQPAFTDAAHEALLAALFRSGSWIALPMITDLFGSAQRFNVPGAIADSNWSQRLPSPPSAWKADPVLGPKLARISALLRETGRA